MVCELLKTKINQLPNTTDAFFATIFTCFIIKKSTQNDYKCNIYTINNNRVKKKSKIDEIGPSFQSSNSSV